MTQARVIHNGSAVRPRWMYDHNKQRVDFRGVKHGNDKLAAQIIYEPTGLSDSIAVRTTTQLRRTVRWANPDGPVTYDRFRVESQTPGGTGWTDEGNFDSSPALIATTDGTARDFRVVPITDRYGGDGRASDVHSGSALAPPRTPRPTARASSAVWSLISGNPLYRWRLDAGGTTLASGTTRGGIATYTTRPGGIRYTFWLRAEWFGVFGNWRSAIYTSPTLRITIVPRVTTVVSGSQVDFNTSILSDPFPSMPWTARRWSTTFGTITTAFMNPMVAVGGLYTAPVVTSNTPVTVSFSGVKGGLSVSASTSFNVVPAS